MIHDFKKWALLAVRAAEEKKALNPVMLDLRQASDIADYIGVFTAESSAQIRAIDEEIERTLKKAGARLLRRDGKATGRWLALDYGGLVIHILTPEAREFYRLEQLWEEARPVAPKTKKMKTANRS